MSTILLDDLDLDTPLAPYTAADLAWESGYAAAMESYPDPVAAPDHLRPWLAASFAAGAEAACRDIDLERLAQADAYEAQTLAYRIEHPEHDNEAEVAELGSQVGHIAD